jgi:hypothetical protein
LQLHVSGMWRELPAEILERAEDDSALGKGDGAAGASGDEPGVGSGGAVGVVGEVNRAAHVRGCV